MRKRGRVDSNQADIVDTIRKLPDFTVAVTSSLGDGFGDLLIGHRGVNGLYEVKDPEKPPSERKLTADEEKFHNAWRGHIKTVLTAAEIIRDMRIEAQKRRCLKE